jgi:hypothetical protein
MHGRRRLEAEAVPVPRRAREHGQVLAAAGRRPGAKREVEAAERMQGARSEGHVAPRTEAAGRVEGEAPLKPPSVVERVDGGRPQERSASRRDAQPVGYGFKAPRAQAAVVLLEPDLRRRLKLGWEDHPGDACLLGMGAKPQPERQQPRRFDEDVIIGERNDLTIRFRQPPVARRRDPRTRFAYHPRTLELYSRRPRRPVVNHDHLVLGIVELRQ